MKDSISVEENIIYLPSVLLRTCPSWILAALKISITANYACLEAAHQSACFRSPDLNISSSSPHMSLHTWSHKPSPREALCNLIRSWWRWTWLCASPWASTEGWPEQVLSDTRNAAVNFTIISPKNYRLCLSPKIQQFTSDD